jgi:hypothetical protein
MGHRKCFELRDDQEYAHLDCKGQCDQHQDCYSLRPGQLAQGKGP